MGDAVLAFFGAPIAHEDDPERAIRAGLGITAEAQRYAEELERERGIEGFNVRVGINTGLVVVGEVGSDLRVEYTAMGDAINLAARVESAAEPGTVLITEATHKLVAPVFETEPLGSIEVKGRTRSVPVYRVQGARAKAGKQRGIAGLESPLVGRETEFRALQEAMERLGSGQGGIVTMVGEAGIGKSRLVAELRSDATHGRVDSVPRPAGALHLTWAEGRCLSYGASVAYLLWLDLLRGLLGVSVEDSPAQIRDVLQGWVQALCPERYNDVYPYVGRLLSLPLEEEIDALLRDMDGKQLKEGTFGAVETLLSCASGEKPLVLVTEDLHWADPTSVELLEKVLPLSGQLPILLICVFRPERSHACWHLRETAAREYRQQHLDLVLEPLSATESASLVANLLAIEDLPGQLKARILDHAEGNPFYLEEVLRSLIDDGAIVLDEARGRWMAMRDVADIDIPDTLQGVLMARIDRLREETKRVLQMAAVIGRIFLYRVLAAIAAAERDVDCQLLTLQQEEMIRERARQPELEYIFKHHLTQEVAYNGLLKKERRVFHRQVAEALERLYPDRVDEQLGLLAYHWDRSGDADKATEYLLRAGDQARLAYAHREAVEYYQRALVFLKEKSEYGRAARTLMKLGLTHHSAFDYRRARSAHDEAFALWQRAGREEPVAALASAPHALRVHLSSPQTLDPNLASDYVASTFVTHLFSGLVALASDLSIEPDVARSWEVSEGGRKWVFRLRDDVAWSDGVAVTAGDFEYAWKRALHPETGSPNASLLYDVAGAKAFHQGRGRVQDVGVRAADERTLVVELEGPVGYFFQLLAYAGTFPLPRHRAVSLRGRWWQSGEIVGNGPFRLASWIPGKKIVLQRNAQYHGRFRGNVDRVAVTLLSEDESAEQLAQYEAGEPDVLDMLAFPGVVLDRARQRHAEEYITQPALSTAYVGFDTSRPPFDDIRVRRAFALATDRERMVGADESPATGGFVPRGMPGHSPGTALPHDPAQARALLAYAGYPGGHGFPPVDAVTISGSESYGDYPETFWRETLGVDIVWETLDWDSYFPRMERDPPHLFGLGWVADYPDPDTFLRVGFFRHFTHWHNPDYERLVERARRSTDQEERMELYARADRLLVEEAPILPLAYQRNHYLVKPWVRAYPTSPIRSLFWKDVIIEAH
jgi:ABC-type oligopeptide transport system substrate-binding subunit